MDPLRAHIVSIFSHLTHYKIMTESYAKELLRLPMLDVPEISTPTDNNFGFFEYFQKIKESGGMDIEDLPFQDATYWIAGQGMMRMEVEETNTEQYYRIYHVTYIPDPIDAEGLKKMGTYAKGRITLAGIRTEHQGKIGVQIDHMIGIGGVPKLYDAKGELMSVTLYPLIDTLFNMFFLTLNAFIAYSRSIGRHPIQRTLQKPKAMKSINKPKARLEHVFDNSPRVIYLDVMPNDANPTGIKQHVGGTKRPHPRIAHKRTLKHPRFKSHELYMVPNAIPVRDSFIGDKTATYQGNIYRLIEKV